MPRRFLIMAGALLCAWPAVYGGPSSTTALAALKLLPKSAVANVALIEAREGRPGPDRWHILVHDPKEENGLHEYVIANGEIVSSRGLSQFAESLTADEVLGDGIKIDSDRAAKLAQQYADANKLELAEMNFELKREGEGAAPQWNVTCIDAEGNELGHLVLTATKGTIVSHEGFAIDPVAADKPKASPEATPVRSEPIAERKSSVLRKPEAKPEVKPEIRKAEAVIPPPEETPRPGFFKRVGLVHLFTGH